MKRIAERHGGIGRVLRTAAAAGRASRCACRPRRPEGRHAAVPHRGRQPGLRREPRGDPARRRGRGRRRGERPGGPRASRGSGRFDALLTDMRMPLMGGAELVHEIRRLDPARPRWSSRPTSATTRSRPRGGRGSSRCCRSPCRSDRLLELLAVARRDGLVVIVEDDVAARRQPVRGAARRAGSRGDRRVGPRDGAARTGRAVLRARRPARAGRPGRRGDAAARGEVPRAPDDRRHRATPTSPPSLHARLLHEALRHGRAARRRGARSTRARVAASSANDRRRPQGPHPRRRRQREPRREPLRDPGGRRLRRARHRHLRATRSTRARAGLRRRARRPEAARRRRHRARAAAEGDSRRTARWCSSPASRRSSPPSPRCAPAPAPTS